MCLYICIIINTNPCIVSDVWADSGEIPCYWKPGRKRAVDETRPNGVWSHLLVKWGQTSNMTNRHPSSTFAIHTPFCGKRRAGGVSRPNGVPATFLREVGVNVEHDKPPLIIYFRDLHAILWEKACGRRATPQWRIYTGNYTLIKMNLWVFCHIVYSQISVCAV